MRIAAIILKMTVEKASSLLKRVEQFQARTGCGPVCLPTWPLCSTNSEQEVYQKYVRV